MLPIVVGGPTRSVPVAGAAQPDPCPGGTGDGAQGCVVTLPCLAQYVGCDPAHPPTVHVGPVSYLQDGQYVSVTTTNFPTAFTDGAVGGTMRVALCSLSGDQTDPLCLGGNEPGQVYTWEGQTYRPRYIPISTLTADRQSRFNLPAFYEPNLTGYAPLPAVLATTPIIEPANPGFFCGDAADQCAVEVTVAETSTSSNSQPGQGARPYDSAANTVVVPLSFAPTEGGCPSTDALLNSKSSYSLEHFLDAAIPSTCGGANGVIDLNTVTDPHTVISDFAAGNDDLGFVDNPGDPTQEATLINGRGFAYIPVAVSATSVGFLGVNESQGSPVGVYDYSLTPTMLSGLLSGDYLVAGGSYSSYRLVKGGTFYSDNLLAGLAAGTPPVTCAQILPCQPPPGTPKGGLAQAQLAAEQQMNGFNLLNPAPAGQQSPAELSYAAGSYMPDNPSGSVYQATTWICQQPPAPMSVTLPSATTPGSTLTTTLTDTNSAGTELVSQPANPAVSNEDWAWPTPGCSTQSTLPAVPAITGQQGTPNFVQYQLPQAQANELRTYVYGGGQYPVAGTYYDGFALMDSSEAQFYGLNMASLQNARGSFVAPSATSIASALANESPCPPAELQCPLGTYAFDNRPAPTSTAYAAGAYPMPDITYAIVPTGPLPADRAAALKSLLTNLVNVAHGTGTTPLPPGYYPLSDSLYQAALTDIGTDIVAAPATPPAAPTTGDGGNPVPAGSASAAPVATTAAFPGSGPLSLLPLTGPIDAGASRPPRPGTARPPGRPRAVRARRGPRGGQPATTGGFLLVSTDQAASLLLPAVVLVALGAFGVGVWLVAVPEVRRRRGRRSVTGDVREHLQDLRGR